MLSVVGTEVAKLTLQAKEKKNKYSILTLVWVWLDSMNDRKITVSNSIKPQKKI